MRKHLLLAIALLCMVVQGGWAQDCSAGTEDELCCRTENRAPRLYKDGYWNTLCLPFDITTFAGTLIDGATVMELDTETEYDGHKTSFNVETGTLYLYFKTATSIEAGKPYIIKWGNTEETESIEAKALNIYESSFEGTGRAPHRASAIEVTSEDGHVSFCGIFAPKTLTGGDKSVLYLGSNNQLYWPTIDVTLNAFRAYFQLNGITDDDIAQASMFTGDDNETTGIVGITLPPGGSQPPVWQGASGYTLDGRKLNGKPTTKGVYIVNGRKVVIK